MILLLPEVKHLVDKEKLTGIFSGISICAEEKKEMIDSLEQVQEELQEDTQR